MTTATAAANDLANALQQKSPDPYYIKFNKPKGNKK